MKLRAPFFHSIPRTTAYRV